MKSAVVDVTTFSEARANLKSVMDKVVLEHVPVIISRRNAEPVVMVSLSEWNGWQETAYLTSTAANRAALAESIAEFEGGHAVETRLEPEGAPKPAAAAE
jgi:antitoxin YefM